MSVDNTESVNDSGPVNNTGIDIGQGSGRQDLPQASMAGGSKGVDCPELWLQTASEIARLAMSQIELDPLLSQAVALIRARLDLSYAGVFLLDDAHRWAVLRSESGTSARRPSWEGEGGGLGAKDGGRRSSELRLPIDGTSRVGRCILQGDAVIGVSDTEEDPPGADESDGHNEGGGQRQLTSQHRCSEAAFPLISRGEAIGAIAVQFSDGGELPDAAVAALITLSSQLAQAIVNAQLQQRAQLNLEELQRLQQRYAMDMWQVYVEREDVLGYRYDSDEITPLQASQQDDAALMGQGLSAPFSFDGSDGGDGAALMQPLEIRGEPVGFMSFEDDDAGTHHRGALAWSEDQTTVLEAVREQLELTLENRLLIDRSQRALREARQREAEVSFLQEVSSLLNATNDVVASRAELFSQFQGFLPINQLTLTGYEDDAGEHRRDQLAWLGQVVVAGHQEREELDLNGSGFEWVATHHIPVVEDDLRVESRFPEDARLVNSGVVSRVLLPLRLGYRTLGAIELGSAQPGVFTRAGLMPILQQLASQVASAMERGNLLTVAQSSAEESQRLYEVTSDLAESMDAADILEAIARHALPATTTARAEIGLFVIDPETGRDQAWLEIVAAYDGEGSERSETRAVNITGATLPIGARLRASELTSVALLNDAQMVVCEDIAHDPRIGQEARAAYLSQGVGALVALSLGGQQHRGGIQHRGGQQHRLAGSGQSEPVNTIGTPVNTTGTPVDTTGAPADITGRIGVLQIRFSDAHPVTEEDRRLYRTISEQAAVVLSNRQLFQESQARISRQSVAVELANLTTSLSERDALLQTSVTFLQERFELYFAGIFLTDDLGQWAVLHAGSGEVGERLMLMGHRVQIESNTMVGRCVDQRSRILALDIDQAAAMRENPLLPETRSAVAFPLISRGQTNGVITLQSTKRFAFTQEDLGTLALMVNQLANVIESTNLYERSQASLAETRMLYRIAQQITDAREADAVLRAAVEGISQRSEPDWIIAGLLEPRDRPTALRVAVSWSRAGGDFPRDSLALQDIQQFYDVLRSDERFVTPNISQDPMADDLIRRIYSELGLRATAAFQLSVRGQQYGTILVHSQNAREFSTAELSFYENVARQAFVALENISLVAATREQAERRDILNEVLQTASSSLERTQILQDVSRVIARRLSMPVLVWECDGTSTAVDATLPVGAYDAGGTVLAEQDAAGTGNRFAGSQHGVNGAKPEALFQLQGRARAQIRAALQDRTPEDVVFGSGPSAPQGAIVGLSEGFASPLVEGYAVPLTARDVVYGVMVLGQQQGHEPIDELEREFMRAAGTNIGVALETASLYLDAQETAKKLKEVDELKNQFMANMSHELRTPLNSIIGFSRVMLKGIDGPITEMQETDLGAIYDSGRHLLNLINDILDISKINAGKMEVIFEPVDLRGMIESVMSTAMGFVKDKPVKLLTDVPDDLPTIVADSRRIRQVLINLLGNAGKFTDEGFIKVSASWDDYQVLISVQDTGIGIPADRIHAVFEQFEQVDSSSSRRYQGTGLGVPLSREFVRMHGGDIWIQQSVVGEGTMFCFSLPIGGPDAVMEAGSAGDSAQGRVVLTVDDDAGVITLFRRYLERHGYKVFGLTRGDRVLEEAIRLKPYAITLDVIMPGLDGWSVIRELKSNPATHDIPIIICSVLGERDRGISMGVADYLTKPISEQALLDTLAYLGDGDGAGRGGSGGTCLVVDDNPDDRKLLRRFLEDAGYDVSEAAGGAAAIAQIDRDAPGLVILDLMMPEVDGFEVLEHLKRGEATRGIPVVVVTAKELTQEDRVRLQQRVEALLQKGLFDQQQLLSDVRAALNRLAV